ncbi:MAG: ABC transporter permease subunit [Ktedonobacteraceae bacterium]|nr:ABC transporter permease subunit [Ktedonobacteraceae bacterium]
MASTMMRSTHISAENTSVYTGKGKPSFWGLVRGELFRLSRHWLTWLIPILYLGGTLLLHLLLASGPRAKEVLLQAPLEFLFTEMQYPALVMRIFGGIFLIILAAYLIGMEYQSGTIRIILARGVGRVQYLLAQVTAVLIIALFMVIIWTAINTLLTCIVMLVLAGNLNAWQAVNAHFWAITAFYMGTILINMGVSVLMAATMVVLSRSLAGGMSLAISWFMVDNMLTWPLQLMGIFLHNELPLKLSGYLLGPVLNVLPQAIGLKEISVRGTFVPLVKIEATQAWLVILAYTVVFIAVSLLLTWKKDVKE